MKVACPHPGVMGNSMLLLPAGYLGFQGLLRALALNHMALIAGLAASVPFTCCNDSLPLGACCLLLALAWELALERGVRLGCGMRA